jgi:hypothetical protein
MAGSFSSERLRTGDTEVREPPDPTDFAQLELEARG